MIGRVVSTKMKSTAVVLVTSTKTHPLYKKAFTRNKKFLAQDDIGVKMGDIVEFVKVRPISKNKHWRIERKVGRSIEEMVGEQLKKQAEEVISEVMPEEEMEEPSAASPQTEETEKPKKPRRRKEKSES